MATVRVSSKGQVVIPAEVREKVGLKPGMQALIYALDNQVIVERVPEDPVEAMCGIFNDPGYSYVDALLKDRREEREREEKELARFVRPAVLPEPRGRLRKRAVAAKKRARQR